MAIDEGFAEKLNVKVTNNLTGEVTEVEVTSAEQAKNLLLELKSSTSALKKAQDNLTNYLDRFLGADEEYQFADGKTLRRRQTVRLEFTTESLRKILDEDQLDVCLKVDMQATAALIAEMMSRNELPGDTLKKLREEAIQKPSSPWVEVR